MLYRAMSLLFGYILAAMFTTSVSMSITMTLWGSIWTYVILLFWWGVGAFILAPLMVFAAMGVLAVFYAVMLGAARIIDKLRGR